MKQLKSERESFKGLWQDIADYVDPFRAQFDVNENNKGNKRASKIIDSTATQCSDVLSAGLMSGMTSPARPWFKLTTQDQDKAKFGKVKEWLDLVTQVMNSTHLRTNIYSTFPYVYRDVGNFGTSPFIVQETKDGSVFHTSPFEIGSYVLGEDHFGRVNTFGREFRMTVGQVVDMFGEYKDGKPDWSNFSNFIKESYEKGNTEKWVTLTHVIHPNRQYSPHKLDAKFKKFKSIYFETNESDDKKILRESGYDLFPILGLRWGAKTGDVYGTSSPAIIALGDIKQLQHGERMTAEALDKIVKPPMKASSSLKESGANLLPAGITWIDDTQANQVFESAYNINFPMNYVEQKQEQIRTRIENAYFKNLFLMLANDQRSGITATEINMRYEEKLVMLGPVLQQFNSDCLDPFIDLSFDYHLRQGLLPPPPEELQGEALKIEYVSTIAQAQKTLGIGNNDKFLNFIGTAAQMNPDVLTKVDFDGLVDDYGDKLSVAPTVIRTRERVEEIRQAQAQAQAQQAQMEQAQMQARAAKDAAAAQTSDGQSLLDQLVGGGSDL